MLNQQHMLIPNDEANIVLNAREQRFLHCRKSDVLGSRLTVEKCLINARQALYIVEDVAKKGIFINTLCLSHSSPS